MPDCSPAEAADDAPRQTAKTAIKRRFMVVTPRRAINNSQPSERVPWFFGPQRVEPTAYASVSQRLDLEWSGEACSPLVTYDAGTPNLTLGLGRGCLPQSR